MTQSPGELIRTAERWLDKVTDFEHRQIAAVKKELDQEYEAQVGLKTKASNDATTVKIQQRSDLTEKAFEAPCKRIDELS